MPYGFTLQSTTIAAGGYSSSGTTNTEIDFAFLKPGAGAKVLINALRLLGRASGVTSLNALAVNMKNWTTASTGGTAMTPRPDSLSGAVASQATAAGGAAGGTGAVSAGSGGGTYRGGCGCSASGPGGWTAQTLDQAKDMIAGYAGSMDLCSLATPLSLAFDWWWEFLE